MLLCETLSRTVLVYTLNLFRLVIVLKLISYCLGFSGFFRWSVWVVSENLNGNTDYDDDVTQYAAIGNAEDTFVQ